MLYFDDFGGFFGLIHRGLKVLACGFQHFRMEHTLS